MRKDFKNIDIYAAFQPANGAEWQKANGISADWKTPEHIEVKPVYTKEDLEGMEHLVISVNTLKTYLARAMKKLRKNEKLLLVSLFLINLS